MQDSVLAKTREKQRGEIMSLLLNDLIMVELVSLALNEDNYLQG